MQEAFVRGYKQAEQDLAEANEIIKLWESRPEFHLAIALNKFVTDIAEEQVKNAIV